MKGQKGPEKITQHFGHVVKGDQKSSKTFQPKRIGGIWMHWVDHEYQWMDRWIPFSLGSDESVNLILRNSDGSKQAGKMSVNLRLRNSDGSKLIRQRLFVAHFALASQNWSPSSWENILHKAFQTVFKIYKLYIKTKQGYPSAFVLFVL